MEHPSPTELEALEAAREKMAKEGGRSGSVTQLALQTSVPQGALPDAAEAPRLQPVTAGKGRDKPADPRWQGWGCRRCWVRFWNRSGVCPMCASSVSVEKPVGWVGSTPCARRGRS